MSVSHGNVKYQPFEDAIAANADGDAIFVTEADWLTYDRKVYDLTYESRWSGPYSPSLGLVMYYKRLVLFDPEMAENAPPRVGFRMAKP